MSSSSAAEGANNGLDDHQEQQQQQHDDADALTASLTASMPPPDAPIHITATTNQSNPKSGPPFNLPAFSPSTEEILKRVSANSLAAATTGTPGWEAAREAVLKNMATSDKIPTPPPRDSISKRGRGGKKNSPLSIDDSIVVPTALPETPVTPAVVKAEAVDTPAPQSQQQQPPSTRGRGRGRGRGSRGSIVRGSTRGRGRGRGRGGARGSKRRKSDGVKREDNDQDDDDDDDDDDDNNNDEDDDAAGGGASDSSENYTPMATTTRSGRAVAKPTAFVPTIPSPTAGQKRKRPFNRRNPELAVCKVCLRPHSPATNMIVFCDGCNTPYHRYCHHPPIDQQVVDVLDMEWYCAECSLNRPAKQQPPEQQPQQQLQQQQQHPDMNLDAFISGQGLTEKQKRDCLSIFPASALVTLLLRADAVLPQIPIFPPGAYAQPMPSTLEGLLTIPPPQSASHPATNGLAANSTSHNPQQNVSQQMYPPSQSNTLDSAQDSTMDEYDEHPDYFPRPGHGLARTLPPEQQDLDWLVDDNYEVYSHIFQTDPQAANDALLPGSGDKGNGSVGVDKGKAIAGNGHNFNVGQPDGGA